MQRQCFRFDAFTLGGPLNQHPGYEFRFAFSYGPADDLATENVDDAVKVIGHALLWPWQFGDIPRPAFIGPGGLQYRHGMLPPALVATTAPVTRQTMIKQQAVHGADAAQVNAFIEQLRVHLLRS